MQCPSCKETIDDDSRYCDQCGEQILVCSLCGRPGKGKRCIFDGKEMNPAGGGAAQQQTTQTDHIDSQPPAQAAPPQQTVAPQAAAQQAAAQGSAAGSAIKLSGRGITIEVSDGDIIGRKSGPFTAALSGFSHVSGAHCKFVKADGNWNVIDLASTNGTFYNNNRLTPNTPVPVYNNTAIKIADIELLLTYDAGGDGTTRI